MADDIKLSAADAGLAAAALPNDNPSPSWGVLVLGFEGWPTEGCVVVVVVVVVEVLPNSIPEAPGAAVLGAAGLTVAVGWVSDDEEEEAVAALGVLVAPTLPKLKEEPVVDAGEGSEAVDTAALEPKEKAA